MSGAISIETLTLQVREVDEIDWAQPPRFV
jgi:hypothetical protein